jgi:hypothetical protein
MGIFKNITKTLKKAAPLIGSTIGFAIGGPAGAAIGSGIGSLAAGRSAEEALLNAGMAYGVGSFAKGAGFGPQATDAGTYGATTGASNVANVSGSELMGSVTPTQVANTIPSTASSAISSVFDFAKANPLLTATGIGALALASGDEEKATGKSMPDYPEGKVRLGTGRIGDKRYNLNDPVERQSYFTANQNRGLFAGGGEVEGPGTGTSDSVPARLSDGEFVVTAKAVRGAGGGDRNVGAARMYDMMSDLERVA